VGSDKKGRLYKIENQPGVRLRHVSGREVSIATRAEEKLKNFIAGKTEYYAQGEEGGERSVRWVNLHGPSFF